MNRLAASLCVAAAVLASPVAALAQGPVAPPAPPAAPEAPETPDTAAMEAAIEAAAAAFEVRMEAFGKRAEAIAGAEDISDDQREARMAALWSDYQPEVAVFTAAIAEHAGDIARIALSSVAELDVAKLVGETLNQPEMIEAMRSAQAVGVGMATNGAWAQNDPEQMITYGLMAQYGMDLALDEAQADAEMAEADAVRPPSTR
jgi:hypothetical protein